MAGAEGELCGAEGCGCGGRGIGEGCDLDVDLKWEGVGGEEEAGGGKRWLYISLYILFQDNGFWIWINHYDD